MEQKQNVRIRRVGTFTFGCMLAAYLPCSIFQIPYLPLYRMHTSATAMAIAKNVIQISSNIAALS